MFCSYKFMRLGYVGVIAACIHLAFWSLAIAENDNFPTLDDFPAGNNEYPPKFEKVIPQGRTKPIEIHTKPKWNVDTHARMPMPFMHETIGELSFTRSACFDSAFSPFRIISYGTIIGYVAYTLPSQREISEKFTTKKNTEYVYIKDMPQVVINAFVASHDQDFFRHDGINGNSYTIEKYIAREILKPVLYKQKPYIITLKFSDDSRSSCRIGLDKLMPPKMRFKSAVNNLSFAVIWNIDLSNEEKVGGRLSVNMLAAQIKLSHSKETILELYMNRLFPSGLTAEAKTNFEKDVKALALNEAAEMAASAELPTVFNPPLNKTKTPIDRRNWVLDRMVEDGYITPAEAIRAKRQPLASLSQQNLITIEVKTPSEDRLQQPNSAPPEIKKQDRLPNRS